mmetsp:Transcript_27837/g.47322  ORF Transcript_27837/g.47322 Transcript_27837/m.47322 type:complete len:235 (-) Transcript_27837:81-785(-)|eukprot:CAMPEP_0183753156 /NCGR_PEP_ID=MMETSP0739-20130205/2769_1 /TAXON_ID=385413 /ORGANISM="Thalassiosira miniscula, Strain CCMP1093" /LENGTH=234 /DNA_ID=CAMNT_0025989599 /DNA_START=45 /DNA_END=749 /DNA_ORIENTATION=-
MITEDTEQISETLANECNITEMQSSAASPPKQLSPKQYRPKPSSLPTSLVRTIQLPADDDNDNTNNDDAANQTNNTIPTTIILQLFSDRIFLSITQLNGKMGSLLVCNVEESIIDNSTTYNVSTVLGTGVARGSSNAEHQVALREVCVRRMVERIVKFTRKMAGVGEGTILGGAEDGVGPIPPLVVGLGLKPSKGGKRMSVESFNAMVDAAVELYEEGWRICHAGALVGMEGPD